MTESRMPHAEAPLAQAPGLQLIGTESDAGLCVDGVCALPRQHGETALAEKAD